MSDNPYYWRFRRLLKSKSQALSKNECRMLRNLTEDEFNACIKDKSNGITYFDPSLSSALSHFERFVSSDECKDDFDFRRIPESHEIYEAFREAVDDVIPSVDSPPKPSRLEKIKNFLEELYDKLYVVVLVLQIIFGILFFPIIFLWNLFHPRLFLDEQDYRIKVPEPEPEDQLHSIYNEIYEEAVEAALSFAAESFSKKLNNIQVQKKLNDSQMAKAIGISVGSYSNYMNTQKLPDKNTLLRIVIGCQLSLEASTKLLISAGRDWGNSKTDDIIRSFINDGVYDLELVDDELMKCGCQPLTKRKRYV